MESERFEAHLDAVTGIRRPASPTAKRGDSDFSRRRLTVLLIN
jgi:hypothetical protein